MRMDKKLVWMLMPDTKMYMETTIKEGKKNSRDVSDCTLDQKISGTEMVNGVKATRSKINMSCPDDMQYTGDMWVTKEGIMVKMDVAGKARGTKSVRMKTELKNLKIAKQDPALFEIPAGYTKMSMNNPMGVLRSGEPKKEADKEDTELEPDGNDTSRQSDSSTDKKNNKDDALGKVRRLFGF